MCDPPHMGMRTLCGLEPQMWPLDLSFCTSLFLFSSFVFHSFSSLVTRCLSTLFAAGSLHNRPYSVLIRYSTSPAQLGTSREFEKPKSNKKTVNGGTQNSTAATVEEKDSRIEQGGCVPEDFEVNPWQLSRNPRQDQRSPCQVCRT